MTEFIKVRFHPTTKDGGLSHSHARKAVSVAKAFCKKKGE